MPLYSPGCVARSAMCVSAHAPVVDPKRPQGGYPSYRARDLPPGWNFRPNANGQGQGQGQRHRSRRELGGACGRARFARYALRAPSPSSSASTSSGVGWSSTRSAMPYEKPARARRARSRSRALAGSAR